MPYVSSPDAGAPMVEQDDEPPGSNPAPVSDPAKHCSWCKTEHKKTPKFHPEGIARLAHVLADPQVRWAVTELIDGLSRAGLDDPNRQNPFVVFAERYNDRSFQPERVDFAYDVHTHGIDPSGTDPKGRGSHSFPFQLNLSCAVHRMTQSNS